MSDQPGDPIRTARAWLQRHIVPDVEGLELDEGDCTICGAAAGESHDPTDSCGIIVALLSVLEARDQALAVEDGGKE